MSHAVASRHGYRGGERRRLGDRTYETWHSMLQRCFNPKNEQYANYGGRGITVCTRWLNFTKFLEDMGEKPNGLSIERLDNDGNYVLSNCRWATCLEQNRNHRGNHKLIIDTLSLTIAAWAERSGVDRRTILSRLRAGWAEKDAVFRPTGMRSLRRQTVLSATDVSNIRRLYQAGDLSQQAIADQFGVCQRTICQVVNRLTWRYI